MSQLREFDRMFRLDGKVALVTGGELKSLLRLSSLTDIVVKALEASDYTQRPRSFSLEHEK